MTTFVGLGPLFLKQFKAPELQFLLSVPRPQLSVCQTLCAVNSTVLRTPPGPGRCQASCPAKGPGSGTQRASQRPANMVTILNIPSQCGHSFNLCVAGQLPVHSCYCNTDSKGFKAFCQSFGLNVTHEWNYWLRASGAMDYSWDTFGSTALARSVKCWLVPGLKLRRHLNWWGYSLSLMRKRN